MFLTSLPFCLVVGTILGFLSGLGIGGGSLLILWLTLAIGMEPADARIVNLLFFLPAALIAALFRWKQGNLNFHIILPAVISGCAAALVITRLTANWNVDLLKKIFGIILMAAGLKELLGKQKKDR